MYLPYNKVNLIAAFSYPPSVNSRWTCFCPIEPVLTLGWSSINQSNWSYAESYLVYCYLTETNHLRVWIENHLIFQANIDLLQFLLLLVFYFYVWDLFFYKISFVKVRNAVTSSCEVAVGKILLQFDLKYIYLHNIKNLCKCSNCIC